MGAPIVVEFAKEGRSRPREPFDDRGGGFGLVAVNIYEIAALLVSTPGIHPHVRGVLPGFVLLSLVFLGTQVGRYDPLDPDNFSLFSRGEAVGVRPL